jgi:glycosyltransferase involved in cell wall biosynthesis
VTRELPRVSVIIPVRNDAARLRRCLEALGRQSLREPFEILVVDNDSSDHPSRCVADHPRARLLFEPRSSSYAARNSAIAAARGDILAFTDADCIPAPDWLQRGVRSTLEAGNSAFVGGRIQVFAHDPQRPTAAELYELMHAFPQRAYVQRHSFSATANLFAKRDVFERVGPFDAELVSSGDFEWGQRARAAGIDAHYADDVLVTHPARMSIHELRGKVRRLHVGAAQLRSTPGRPQLPEEGLWKSLRPPLRSTARNFSKLEPASLRSSVLYAGAALFVHYLHAYRRLSASWPRSSVRGLSRSAPTRA